MLSALFPCPAPLEAEGVEGSETRGGGGGWEEEAEDEGREDGALGTLGAPSPMLALEPVGARPTPPLLLRTRPPTPVKPRLPPAELAPGAGREVGREGKEVGGPISLLLLFAPPAPPAAVVRSLSSEFPGSFAAPLMWRFVVGGASIECRPANPPRPAPLPRPEVREFARANKLVGPPPEIAPGTTSIELGLPLGATRD